MPNLPNPVFSSGMIAACGLFCGTCRSKVAGKCDGCRSGRTMGWCRNCAVRLCTAEKGYGSCAECGEHADLRGCRKLNDFRGRLFALLFRSDRIGCLERIREAGRELYAAEMTAAGSYNRPVERK